MYQTALSSSYLYKIKKSLIPRKIKALLCCTILFLSFFSGQILQFNDLYKSGLLVFASNMENQFAQTKNKTVLGEKTTQKYKSYQFRQLSIGQQTKAIEKEIEPDLLRVTNQAADNSWGVARKIADHTYTMQIEADEQMATPQEILQSLNDYRLKHNRGVLQWNENLANFAKDRVNYFIEINNLDSHKGFMDYLDNQDGFKKLGFHSLGENSSLGFKLQGVHLIEWVYAGDNEHNDNQLNSQWQYVGIGVNGTATDLIFGADKQ